MIKALMTGLKKFFCALGMLALVCLPVPGPAAAAAPNKLPFDDIVKSKAGKHKISSALVHSIILHESNYNIYAVSSKGALGLMQLMPDTARQYGVKNVFDPEDNIEGGIKYLKDLTKLYENEKNPTTLILAAYNAGQEAVKKYGGKIPDYPETRAYIKQVMDTYALLPQKRPTRIITFYDSEGRLQVTNDLNKAALLRGRQN